MLRAELADDRAVVARLVERIRSWLPGPGEAPAEETVYALGLLLHHVYTALETIMERIARQIDGDVPAGPEWHRELLRRMFLDVPGVRPAVFPRELLPVLDELRRFRHVVRHLYGAALEWERLAPLAARLPEVHAALEQALDGFDRFLQALAARGG